MDNINKELKVFTAIDSAITEGNLALLKPDERVRHYKDVCESVGLNPMVRPFDYLKLNGKLVLYANKNTTDQLRALKGISIYKVEEKIENGLYITTAYAKDSHGREDVDSGAVSINGLKGDSLANAIMKSITKAKRRVTLSLSGLSMIDESEIDTISLAEKVKDDIVIDYAPKDLIEKLEELLRITNEREWFKRCLDYAKVSDVSLMSTEQVVKCIERLEKIIDLKLEKVKQQSEGEMKSDQ